MGELRSLVERAEAKEEGASEELRGYLARVPDAGEQLGRLLPSALDVWVMRRAGESPALRELVTSQVGELRAGLLSGRPSTLEQLLVDRVLVCWLAMECCEAEYLSGTSGSFARPHGEYLARRVDRAHGRLLSACRALAQLQRGDAPQILAQVVAQHATVG